MKKAVMIIAENNFRDEELLEPKAILERNNIQVTIASTKIKEISGMLGARVTPDILLSDVKAEDFDAIIFIGGAGASQYWNDQTAHNLIKNANKLDKVIAAICIAPVILANSGVLSGKKATVWSSEAEKLKANDVFYSGKSVEIDGKIITADGPYAATEFAQVIVKALR